MKRPSYKQLSNWGERERESKLAYSETELDWTQSNNENTSQNRDRAIPNDLRRTHHTGLSRTHTVPASRMQKRFTQILIITFVSETHFQLKTRAQPQLTKLKDVCEEELKFTVPVRTRATYELISHALKYLYLYIDLFIVCVIQLIE